MDQRYSREHHGAFFDAFDTGPAPKVSRKLAAKTMSQTMRDLANEDWVDGVELLKIAAEATRSRMVLYDLPKNTNKESLGRAALAAGYRGNIRLEEHFLNGRLPLWLGLRFFGGA